MKRHSTRRQSSPAHSSKHTTPHHSNTYHTHTHRLLYIITILLIFIVLFVVFSYPFTYQTTQPVPIQSTYALTVNAASCTWKDNAYEICETVSWQGTSATYAKGYIPGGEQIETSPSHTSSPFTYCQTVGTESGYRIVRALLYDQEGLVKDVGKGVSCEPQPVQPTPPARQRTYTMVVNGSFSTHPPLGSSKPFAQGIYTKTFPDKVTSCTIRGRWITDDDLFGSRRQFCHGAEGTFTASADATEQYVTNDPNYFSWSGLSKAKSNPPPTTYEGYIMYMHICDNNYHREPRYYARSTVTGFDTKTLTFDWEYFDDETQPAVNFIFQLDCTLTTR